MALKKDPRISVSQKTHATLTRAAKKGKTTLKEMSEKVATAGIRALRIK